jgi:hypothetical protein
LKLFARFVIEFVRKETVDASHVADGRDEYIQKDRRERPSRSHPGVALQYFFVVEIHADSNGQYKTEEETTKATKGTKCI